MEAKLIEALFDGFGSELCGGWGNVHWIKYIDRENLWLIIHKVIESVL